MLAFQLALAAAGLAPPSAADVRSVENAISENLSAQGAVDRVELGASDDGSLAGFALIHDPAGRVGRFACTAQPAADGGFDWHCNEVVDALVIGRLEDHIRQSLGEQGTVTRVELLRRDDDHAAGYALLRDEHGNEVRMTCTAARQQPDSVDFDWTCNPPS